MGTGASVFVVSRLVSRSPLRGCSPKPIISRFPVAECPSTPSTMEQPAEVHSPIESVAGSEVGIGILVQEPSDVSFTRLQGETLDAGASAAAIESPPSPRRSRSASPSFKKRTQGLFKGAVASIRRLSPSRRPRNVCPVESMEFPLKPKAGMVVRRSSDLGSGHRVAFEQDYATSAELAQRDDPPRQLSPSPLPETSRTFTSEEMSELMGNVMVHATVHGYPHKGISLFVRSAQLWAYDANLSSETNQMLFKSGHAQEHNQALEAEVADVRFELAKVKMKLAGKEIKHSQDQAVKYRFPSPTSSQLELLGQSAGACNVKERRGSVRDINVNRFIGVTQEENMALEAKLADKRLALAEEATRYKLILKTTSVLEAELASLKVQLDEESLRLSTCKQD